MTKSRSTKSALIASILALCLCFTMLVGTTFAWFTDSVTSSSNVIMAGNLDIVVEYTLDGENWNDLDGADDLFQKGAWEPGHTEVVALRIKNNGNLALKYAANMNIVNEKIGTNKDGADIVLSDILTVGTLVQGANQIGDIAVELAFANENMYKGTTAFKASNVLVENQELLPGDAHYVIIKVDMAETVGDEANAKDKDSVPSIEFGINVFATQLAYESDSFGDQYDAMATVDTEAELLEALAADYDLISLGANVNVTSTIVIPKDRVVTIDLMGYTVSQVNAQQTAAYAMIDNCGTLTVKDSIGTGKISYTDNTPYTADPGWASNTIKNTGTLTINGGTVENLTPEEVKNFGYPHAIDAYQGSVTTINGGTVKSLNYDSIRMFCNSDTLATKVVINGGTIVNRVSFQDPHSTRPGCGILEINGGNFVTMNGVTANVRLLNFCQDCSNMKATVTGGTFDAGVATQDYANCGIVTGDWLSVADGVAVADVWNGEVPTTMPRSLVVDGATATIHVKDAAAFAYLSTLSAKWAEFYTDGQGTDYTNYVNGAGENYYYSGKWTVSLEFDINLNNKEIAPVKLEFGESTGESHFDGKNHTINNAVIKTDSTTENEAGLFNPSRCTLKNLKLDNIHVTGSNVGNSTAGVLAGGCNFAVDNITITNSSVTGGKYTGGVIGYGYTDVTNCTLINVTVKGGYKLGGVIGYICASGTNTGEVTGNTLVDCTVKGNDGIYAGGKDKYIVGKIVGNWNCDGTCNNNTITNMTTSATENIGEIEAGKTVNQ